MEIGPQGEISHEKVNPVSRVFVAGGRLRAFWRFVLAIIVVAAANILGGYLAYVIFQGHPLARDAGYRFFTTALCIGGFWLLLRHVDHVEVDPLEAQGLGFRGGWFRDFTIGLGVGFVLVTFAVAAIAMWGTLQYSVKFNAATVRHSLTILVLLLAGAALEEVMFRGYPFQRLVESIGAWGAIIALSALFGAAHLKNPNSGGVLSWGFFNTLAIGVVFSLAYLRTRSLWLPIGFHFAWNFSLGFIYGLPVSGMSMFSTIVRGQASGPLLLTGGEYGIEDSLTGAIIIVLALGFVLLLPKRAAPQNEELAAPAIVPPEDGITT